ncbi:hypothetical protein FN846DRAFT_203826 [Sphaerosporella brunnea]|uniref:Uncharacterized protein n=1 Tax=Sphaerosporella brunnea TaxID=1250544 RepID=A0A5J5F7C6_9PEZI|nr:hypothetical protein FN846DRAFT_203826 [Sphaerosporella brunnea]
MKCLYLEVPAYPFNRWLGTPNSRQGVNGRSSGGAQSRAARAPGHLRHTKMPCHKCTATPIQAAITLCRNQTQHEKHHHKYTTVSILTNSEITPTQKTLQHHQLVAPPKPLTSTPQQARLPQRRKTTTLGVPAMPCLLGTATFVAWLGAW